MSQALRHVLPFGGRTGKWRNRANWRRKWLSFLGSGLGEGRGSRLRGLIHWGLLEVLEDFEGAEEHAVGGFDAALEAVEGFDSVLVGVAEREVVLEGGVDKFGASGCCRGIRSGRPTARLRCGAGGAGSTRRR
jgi:hypothetical protein